MESTVASKKLAHSQPPKRPSIAKSHVNMPLTAEERRRGTHDLTVLALLVKEMMQLVYDRYISDPNQKRPSRGPGCNDCIDSFKTFYEQIIIVLQGCHSLSQHGIALMSAAANEELQIIQELLRYAEVFKGNIDDVLAGIDEMRRSFIRFHSILDPLVGRIIQSSDRCILPKNGTSLSAAYSKLKEDFGASVNSLYLFWHAQKTEFFDFLSRLGANRTTPYEGVLARRNHWIEYSHIISATIDSIRDSFTVVPAGAAHRHEQATHQQRDYFPRDSRQQHSELNMNGAQLIGKNININLVPSNHSPLSRFIPPSVCGPFAAEPSSYASNPESSVNTSFNGRPPTTNDSSSHTVWPIGASLPHTPIAQDPWRNAMPSFAPLIYPPLFSAPGVPFIPLLILVPPSPPLWSWPQSWNGYRPFNQENSSVNMSKVPKKRMPRRPSTS